MIMILMTARAATTTTTPIKWWWWWYAKRIPKAFARSMIYFTDMTFQACSRFLSTFSLVCFFFGGYHCSIRSIRFGYLIFIFFHASFSLYIVCHSFSTHFTYFILYLALSVMWIFYVYAARLARCASVYMQHLCVSCCVSNMKFSFNLLIAIHHSRWKKNRFQSKSKESTEWNGVERKEKTWKKITFQLVKYLSMLLCYSSKSNIVKSAEK